jgi:hypothetical protein
LSLSLKTALSSRQRDKIAPVKNDEASVDDVATFVGEAQERDNPMRHLPRLTPKDTSSLLSRDVAGG